MNKLLFLVTAVLLILSGTFVAQSAQAGDQCQDIRARWTLTSFEENCTFDGEDFLLCFDGDLKGKSKGTWFGGIKDGWDGLFVDGAVLSDGTVLPTPEGTSNWWWREFEVFTLKKGRLFGDAQYVIDTRIYDVDAASPIPITITGGTGIYEDASGWILVIMKDTFFDKASIRGEVCGPYIPYHDDDDDDDDD